MSNLILPKRGPFDQVDLSPLALMRLQSSVAFPPVEYDDINILSDGFILNKEGRKWQVDLGGNIIQPFMYDGTYYLNYPVGYSENGDIQYAFADYLKYEVAGSYGIFNRITDEAITPAIHSDINMLSQKIFEVQDSESYDWYLIDTEGNVVSTK